MLSIWTPRYLVIQDTTSCILVSQCSEVIGKGADVPDYIYTKGAEYLRTTPLLTMNSMLKHITYQPNTYMTVNKNIIGIIKVDFMAKQLDQTALDCTGAPNEEPHIL